MRIIALFQPALHALRDRRALWGLLVVTVAIAVTALGPVALLTRATDLGPRLVLPALHSTVPPLDLGPDARPFPVQQADAFGTLFRVATVLAGLTLLVALVTLATQAAARHELRAPEYAVRRAVGASRRLLVGAALVESVILLLVCLGVSAVPGTVIGAATLGRWPGTIAAGSTLLPVVLALVAGVLLLGGLGGTALQPERRVTERSARPLPLILPTLNFALALIAVTSGALLLRRGTDLSRAAAAAPGAGAVVELSLPGDPADRARAVTLLLDTLRGDAFDSASLGSPGAIAGLGTYAPTMTDCGVCYQGGFPTPYRFTHANHLIVTPDSFRHMGVRLLEGRLFTDADTFTSSPVAVIDRYLAAKHFQGGQAVGRRIKIGPSEAWHTVVGVVAPAEPPGLGAGRPGDYVVYLDALQHPPTAMELVVRGPHQGSDDTLARALRRATGLPARAPVPEAMLRAAEVGPLRWFGRIYALQGIAILLLGIGGTALQMVLWVRSLHAELGMRRAVGASRRRLLVFVSGQALRVAGLGVGIGLWFAPGVWVALGEMLPGLPGWDPATVVQVSLLIVTATVIATLIPALRALRHSPATLLGSES